MSLHYEQKLNECKLSSVHLKCYVSSVHEAGEGLDFQGEPLIREESMEMEVAADRTQDAAGNLVQTEEEEEEKESPSTEQQTQESEVCLILCHHDSLSHSSSS